MGAVKNERSGRAAFGEFAPVGEAGASRTFVGARQTAEVVKSLDQRGFVLCCHVFPNPWSNS